ncbi:hypothetical protein SH2C18_08480 [Clostridium sediminicola]|uniref:hypothetical protein n=1 Tax=Clostridium sediminicola TaxID=3114879 RepID=UPI0031F27DE7
MNNQSVNCFPTDEEITDSTLLAFKVFGQCYQQECLKPTEDSMELDENSTPIDAPKLGEDFSIEIPGTDTTDAITVNPNEFINVTDLIDGSNVIDGTFKICSIDILSISKSMIKLENGYWDIKIRYIFTYNLELLDENGNVVNVINLDTGEEIGTFGAYSVYNKIVTLFGGRFESENCDVVVTTTLLQPQSLYTKESPQALIEAKAINYQPYIAEIDGSRKVTIVIGLFTINKLFRIVSMIVEGRDSEVPECEEIRPYDPCTAFKEMDFPFDCFNPSDV